MASNSPKQVQEGLHPGEVRPSRAQQRAMWHVLGRIQKSRLAVIRTLALLACAVGVFAGCSTLTRSGFTEAASADLIVRYYSDQTSYVLKPQQMDGPFLRILSPDAVANLAQRQPNRGLAVVTLVYYSEDRRREQIQREWRQRLQEAGYQRIVFLVSAGGLQVDNCEILSDSANPNLKPPAAPYWIK